MKKLTDFAVFIQGETNDLYDELEQVGGDTLFEGLSMKQKWAMRKILKQYGLRGKVLDGLVILATGTSFAHIPSALRELLLVVIAFEFQKLYKTY